MPKKRHVIYVIEKHIQDFDFGGNLSNLPYREAAKLLLKELEKAGMQPKPYRHEDGDIGSCFKKGWEPEDE